MIQCIGNLVFCITPVFIVVFSTLYDILDELSLGNGIFTIVIKAVFIQIIDTGQSFSHGRRYGIDACVRQIEEMFRTAIEEAEGSHA